MTVSGAGKTGHSVAPRGAGNSRFTPEQVWRTDLAKRVYVALFQSLKQRRTAKPHLQTAALLIRIGRNAEAEYHYKDRIRNRSKDVGNGFKSK